MVDIENTIRLEIDTRLDRRSHGLSSLKPGNIVSARIVGLSSDNRIELDFGGRYQAEAHYTGAAKPGQFFHLKVLSTGPPLHLQLMPSDKSNHQRGLPQMNLTGQLSQADQEQLFTLLTKITDQFVQSGTNYLSDQFKQAANFLNKILQPLSLNSSSEDMTGKLIRLIEDGGLFWEKKVFEVFVQLKNTPDTNNPKLASSQNGSFESTSTFKDTLLLALSGQDLKRQLFILRTFIQGLGESNSQSKSVPANRIEFLTNVIGQLFEHIEIQQNHIIQRHSLTEQYQIISHWIPLEGQDQPLKLKLYYPKRKGSEICRLPHQVCLLLDLDAIGPLRIDLTMMDRQLQIVFSVVDQHLREFIEMRTASMIDTLQGVFLNVSSTVRVAPEKIEIFETEDTDELEKGRVDIRA